ncbi:MAG: hypothetical protein IPM40_15615 [Gammaproteobacteria bacterium]|nr:hypothetical protein [Gammaproteobacteria bacterium]
MASPRNAIVVKRSTSASRRPAARAASIQSAGTGRGDCSTRSPAMKVALRNSTARCRRSMNSPSVLTMPTASTSAASSTPSSPPRQSRQNSLSASLSM